MKTEIEIGDVFTINKKLYGSSKGCKYPWKRKNRKKTSMSDAKQISNRKRRMFLKNEKNWDKI